MNETKRKRLAIGALRTPSKENTMRRSPSVAKQTAWTQKAQELQTGKGD
jgi:hypothetical protein